MIRVRATKYDPAKRDTGAYVHFGYDYYMYLGSDVPGATLGLLPTGLYFEKMDSPHTDSAGP